MAARWEDFGKDEDDYYLQYRTAGDNNVRPEHAALHGVTLPMSDSFWSTYYPPNGWNCRCTVIQVLKSKYQPTDNDEAMSRGSEVMADEKAAKMFAFNSGKEQRTFPAYNPYTISRCATCDKANLNLVFIPNNQVCQACMTIQECERRKQYQANHTEYERLKANKNYTDVAFNEESGGVKATSLSHKKDNGKEQPVLEQFTGKQLEKRCQDNLFRMGKVCILEPESLRVDNKWASCLDATIDGERMDIASITKNTGNIYYNTITRKESQILKFNTSFKTNSHCLALYFEDEAMFDEQKIKDALSGYKEDNIHKGIIDTIYCIINGASDWVIIK